jgi:hypothetical protein
MDATSPGGNGFDEALKALEDLETSVVAKPALAIEPVGTIAFSDDEADSPPAAIVAVPVEEADPLVADLLEQAIIQDAMAELVASPSPAAVAAPVAIAPAAAPASSRMLKLAVGLGLVSSIISAAGLVVAERTIMSAQLVVADARERAEQLEKANRLIRDLEIVRAKQVELLQAQQAQLASAPVTSAELQHRMDNLQSGLIARDPLNNVVAAIRAGHAENAARFNEFGMKMARLEQAIEGR